LNFTNAIKAAIVATTLAMTASVAAAQNLTSVTLASSSSSLPAGGLRLANELGLFKKHGLDAKITPMDSGAVATLALLSNSVEFSNSGPNDVVINNAKGQDVVLVMSTYHGNPGVLVLSKKKVQELGISPSAPLKDKLKALDGLSIATPSATSTYTVAGRSAETVGARVKFVYMAQPAMVAALETGAIDGYIASSPFWTAPVLRNEAVVWVSGPAGEWPEAYSPVNAVTVHTTGKYAAKNPQIVKAVRDVGKDLAAAFKERPQEVKAAISRLFPDLNEDTIDLIIKIETPAFSSTRPVTAEDMAKEIAFARLSGVELPPDDKLKPASMIAP